MSVPALVAPPIRVCLEDAFTREQGGRNNPVPAIEKLWYLYWQALGDRVSGLVGYGRSDERPDPASVPDGALYGQVDPGYVIYQNIEGEWHYVAGTMYATLNPDQRPTDLGPNDAGFDFRAIDTDTQYSGREFIWSGSEWVESTPARYGTHAARLAMPLGETVNGMLWTETDRTEVIYQNQDNAWHYLSGTMWGTISPDQRPTDLGANDAGFDFRSIDTDPLLGGHEWEWSGSVWIETTPNRYGTHAARLALTPANTWNGMIWSETDRSEVIYQLQSGVWHFCAGTMWGTLTPDQRPTDLGANDAGFTFRGTDVQRSFIWSGTVWVETTQVQGSLQIAYANTNFTLSTSPADLPGASLTLSRAGTYLITACLDFSGAGVGDNAAVGIGQLVAGGATQPGLVLLGPLTTVGSGLNSSPMLGRCTAAQQWSYAASAGAVAKVQAYKNVGTGASTVTTQSSLTALWVSP